MKRFNLMLIILLIASISCNTSLGPLGSGKPENAIEISILYAPESDVYMKEAMEAHTKMMEHMQTKPSGDPDKDFVMMMIPHHQGAVDMARLELKYGKDAELRALAENIISSQEKEIVQMKAWQDKVK